MDKQVKFQPVIKWSGSKRSLSKEIINYFPKNIKTYFEPFAGGCSVLFQLINSDINVDKYICSDTNVELIEFFNLVKEDPLQIYNEYKCRWEALKSRESIEEKKDYYYFIRNRFNTHHDVHDFVFLTRTAVNGLIRYNSKGEFNSSFHLTRDGIKPDSLKEILMTWSEVLKKSNVEFVCCDYREITPQEGDFVFLDPPYINTKGMYHGGIDYEELWNWMSRLKCNYALTFDGKTGSADHTYNVPCNLYSKHIYLDSKISGFRKLKSKKEYVSESLYLK